MSKAYDSLPHRGWWGLMLFALVFSLAPGWQSSGTGQAPSGTGQAPLAEAKPSTVAGEIVRLPLAGGASAGDCMGFARPASDGGQIITLINTSPKWMAVYHVDGAGQIVLIGSRSLQGDFTIQYNAVEPLPEDIRRMVGQ